MTQAYLSIPYHWNKPKFRHQTLNIFCQYSLLWILVWHFTKQFLLRAIRQRIAAKYRKATDWPSESTQIIQTAEHGVTASLIPRYGMRRQWFLAHPPPNGEPKWSESEVKAPLLPRLCPRGGGGSGISNDWCISFHGNSYFSILSSDGKKLFINITFFFLQQVNWEFLVIEANTWTMNMSSTTKLLKKSYFERMYSLKWPKNMGLSRNRQNRSCVTQINQGQLKCDYF